MDHTPLKIRWRFARPMIARQHEIHLDALLARARVIEAQEDWSVQHDLPLERAQVGDAWCFKASALVFDSMESVRLTHMTRRTDIHRISLDGEPGGPLNLRQAKINLGSGTLKGYSWFQHTQWVNEARAWCVGDRERVTELLARITSIGKLGRNSFGLIKDWDVDEAEPDEHNHWLYRALPGEFSSSAFVSQADSLGIDYAQSMGRWLPPYWSPEKDLTLEPVRRHS